MNNTKYPTPPPGPPGRTVGMFGETKESVRRREDYQVYMKGWTDGFNSSKNSFNSGKGGGE